MPCTRELVLFFIPIAILTLAKFLLSLSTVPRDRRRSISSCVHSTLDSIKFCLAPPGFSLVELVKERADSNVRLAQALGLTNTFVNPDTRVHADFVKRARGLLKDVQASGWTRFRDICGGSIRSTLAEYPHLVPSKEGNHDIPFDHFIQIVVLRTILAGLLNTGKDAEDLDISSLAQVTSLVNDLWTLSKKDAPPPSHLSRSLHDHLGRLLPIGAGFENPIDLVVPTWETMWRVCAVTIARTLEAENYAATFREFLQTEPLTTQQFDTAGSHGFSVKNFVEEVMRLHPPVKHISRLRNQHSATLPSNPPTFLGYLRGCFTGTSIRAYSPSLEVADVGSVLQDRAIWGHDADVFNPWRHQTQDPQMKETLKLVFGYGSLRCIAASWAPVAAAIMCATILEECREAGWEVVSGERIGGRLGWDGWRLVNLNGEAAAGGAR